jgi:DNA-binding transcriptional LysR family regulator
MEFRHLRYFVVLAEELHFGRAAQRLAITQPPLSLNIQQLEASLGARLFDRDSKGVRLTAAGQAFRTAALALLAQAEQARALARDIDAGVIGRLRVGFVGAVLLHGLPQWLAAHQLEHPGIQIAWPS